MRFAHTLFDSNTIDPSRRGDLALRLDVHEDGEHVAHLARALLDLGGQEERAEGNVLRAPAASDARRGNCARMRAHTMLDKLGGSSRLHSLILRVIVDVVVLLFLLLAVLLHLPWQLITLLSIIVLLFL